ncbi:hypothetical protein COCC4DRAFT_48001 [Bipolaris maydis ATCC 48331]|uniref:LYC1 C-terminal domain-containing protein n=2 Tax=Cochliobolus heterostrophus TaxID=5016 RepID=M2UU83_COCH5|nr:uncharacterized protein COCC4DRAFT_48001 [Bipolaris maydis ATCC 48331]EMD91408.1 hypothetical protein COCHEDRAFT_1224572 [Bipolaris maydis C5]KAJ5027401.1 hypothetical protein J3E73DRAFT_381153 [Bipolaris maydis]ENI08835.1 hypothetical protein COCC4DRAFT_48001 [Bipolaris maydis ATCC 48331]KAJ6202414.1 hypothetical protein J3E72DRAFT_275356 [Bipolaris maydis]KAJ6208805.1 hypothetical protein PSV09DRAFT_1224572 [Bipolaris maydis]
MAITDNLPKGDSPSLALVHPTDAEKLMQFKLNGEEWRGALKLPAYLRREDVLAATEMTRDGGISYWILVDTSLPNNPLDPQSRTRLPLASCETYRKKAWVWQDGTLKEVICHGVGSVFCANHLRKRGYAQRMMTELGETLKTYQTEDGTECLFSVLYSDIGKKFYNTFGWEPFSSSHVSIPGTVSQDSSSLPTARPLYAEDLQDLCETDVALVRRELESRPKGSNTAVALIPNIETIRWHHAREEFVANELHSKKPQVKGAIVGTEKGKRVWCYWTRMWYNQDPTDTKGNTLYILRVVTEDGGCEGSSSHANGTARDDSHADAVAALLAMAQREAEEWKMEKVEMWAPSLTALAAAKRLHPSANVVHRDVDSVASLRWYPEHKGPVANKIDWVINEKYAWC